ncbi:hypothetical protein FKM82_014283 [Ascaphus truei]|uniref:monocarboxylate transporter 9 isoform X2 n=1 Tax=Ascaphus truei TaxID=8439 RepID=UPI003F59D1C4
MTYQRPPNGGWGWVIVTVSFFIQFLCYGSPLAVGVLYVEWLDVFDEGKGKTAWVGSLAAGVGLLASFGCGLLYTATVTVTCQYFEKRRGLALGIISTGSSVGTFIYAGLQKELIELYGLDGCLLIVGALSLNILACGILMRPLTQSSSTSLEKPCLEKIPDPYLIYHEKDLNIEENIGMLENISGKEKGLTRTSSGDCKQENINKNGFTFLHTAEKDTYINKVAVETHICRQLAKNKCHRCLDYWEDTKDLFKNKVFSALCVAILLFDIGGFPPSLLLEDVAKSSNIDEESIIVPLVSITGFLMAIGKLILGILADCKWINTLYLYVFTILATGFTLFAVPFANTYATLATLAGILGFLSGNWSIFPYVTTNTVGLDKLTHAYGILMFFAGIGNCIGPPLVGWCYDWTQTYDIAFYFSGMCVLLGGLLLLIVAVPFWTKCIHRKSEPPPTSYCYKVASNDQQT